MQNTLENTDKFNKWGFKKMDASYGGDPEMSILHKKSNKIVSSIPILKQDKHNPIDLGNGIRTYSDGVAIECAFPPQNNKEGFIGIFRETFGKIKKFLGDEYEPVFPSAHFYDDEEMKDPKAWEVGCNPNLDARNEIMNEPIAFVDTMRSNSCHIHLGNEKLKKFETRHDAVKLFNAIVGCASVIFENDKTSVLRRKIYGRAWEFRRTDYGIECRTLSPYAMRSPELLGLVYDLTEYTLSIIESEREKEFLALVNLDDVENAINTCNKDLSRKVLAQIKLPEEFLQRIEKKYVLKTHDEEWGI